jgi:hypothetical protein
LSCETGLKIIWIALSGFPERMARLVTTTWNVGCWAIPMLMYLGETCAARVLCRLAFSAYV